MHRFVSARLLLLIALLLILEYALSPSFFFLRGRVDLLYLVILDYAFSWSWESVPFFALMMGFLRDLLGAHLFGIETVSLAASGFLLSLGIQKLERENLWVRFVIGLLFIGISETLSLSLAEWLENLKNFSWGYFSSVFWTTLYTGALAPFFFAFTNRWFQRVSVLKQGELF